MTKTDRPYLVEHDQNEYSFGHLDSVKLTFLSKYSNKYLTSKYHWIGKFRNNINLKKLNFLSAEKISERNCFVNKDISQS